MPLVTVRFTRVFDKLAGEYRGRKYTVFSFDSDIGIRYGAGVPAHTPIEAGMCVTAYLEKADCWGSVVGWRNHTTGELVIEDASQYWLFLIGGAFMAIFGVAMFRHWEVLVIMTMPLLFPLAELRKIRRAQHALEGQAEA